MASVFLATAAATSAWAEETKKKDDATELSTIEVADEADKARGPVGGLVARRTATATKTDTPIAETPVSISVVSREQMEEQGAKTVQEALRYEPGVVSDARPGNRYDTVFLRGFGGFGGSANYVQYWDGLRLFKGVNYAVPSIDPYLLERIDIARGPGSALYGQGNPGGSVDLIGKWADDHAYDEIFAEAGTKGAASTGADVGGKLSADGTLFWRFVGVGRRTEGDTDHSDGQRLLLAPMLTWKPDAATTVRLQASWQRDPSGYYSQWVPALGTLQKNPNGQISRDFYAGNPYFDNYDRTQASLAYQVEHRFDQTWTVRQNFRVVALDSDMTSVAVPASGSAWAAASACGGVAYRCLARSSSRYVESLRGVTLDNQAEAHFATGALDHRMLFGFDLQRSSAESTYGSGTTSYVDYLSPSWSKIATPALTTRQSQDRTQLGFYAQDQIAFGNWRALLGVREDVAHADVKTTTLSSGSTRAYSTDDAAFTWRTGLLYQFDNGFAPYIGYSTSFDPSLGTGYGGKPFDPTTAQQYEVGLKYKPTSFDGLFTLSLFDLTQQNVLTTDTLHTSTNTAVTLCSSSTCQTQTGEVRSRGVEIGGKAKILPEIELTAAYAYTDAVVTRSNVSGVQGKVPVGVPKNSASAWADYTWSTGVLAGLTVGGGVRYVGESFGDQTNTEAMRVPGRVLFDIGTHYDFSRTPGSKDGWRASLNVTNLTDKYYVSACASANQCFIGSGRTITAALRYRW